MEYEYTCMDETEDKLIIGGRTSLTKGTSCVDVYVKRRGARYLIRLSKEDTCDCALHMLQMALAKDSTEWETLVTKIRLLLL